MRRLPVVPTLIVVAAIAVMVALGIWQLQRRAWKAALIDRYAAATTRPAVAFPLVPPLPDAALFRRSSVMCLAVAGWQVEAGRDRGGRPGWRHVGRCRTGAEGPGALVDFGVSSTSTVPGNWQPGLIRGMIAPAPSHGSPIRRLVSGSPPTLPMLVADRSPAGLDPSATPSPSEIPNNHLSYAIQWFSFAVTAAAIYALALRRRAIADHAPPR